MAAAKSSADLVSEFLQQNRRLADWVETVKGHHEPENHWRARREFILHNLKAEQKASGAEPEPGLGTDQLLALSMVWANHVFLGCRYSKAVMDKVLEMGEGIKVTDAPVHTRRDDLVNNKSKKRELSNSSANEKIKEQLPAPEKADEKDTCMEFDTTLECTGNGSQDVDHTRIPGLDGFPSSRPSTPLSEPQVEVPVCMAPSTSSNQKEARQVSKETEVKKVSAPTQVLVNQQKTLLHQPDTPAQAKNFLSSSAEVKPNIQPDSVDRPASISNSQKAVQLPVSESCKTPVMVVSLTPEAIKEKQTFYNKLYKAIAWKLVSAGGFSNELNHLSILTNCIQSVKGTLESVCVPLKDISELHLPQSSAREGIVCELRCKAVYLATGYGKCKVSAKDMAAKEAMKLFLKHRVTVKICKRKFKGSEIEDLVLLSEESYRLNLAPALVNPSEPSTR
ncbi:CDKN2A-interacting protein isoform X2 [Stegostoma tigrinum]|uniref:CDKN2A-interacting protein isoform X2 n=1 Tax=Stegostoma tigrinum TaxID=3053191 RepID=UPI00286FEAF5|nr:CDKN2A-interacting protein isoform X2 [Stegostoma tigrinum]